MSMKKIAGMALMGASLLPSAVWAADTVRMEPVRVVELKIESAYTDASGKSVPAARLRLSAPHVCGSDLVYLTAESVGAPPGTDLSQGYQRLTETIKSETPVKIGLSECIGKAVLITELKDCEPGECKDLRPKPAARDGIVYLDENLQSVTRADAQYQLKLPLPRDKATNLWTVRVMLPGSSQVYLQGYADAEDFVSGKLVRGYKTYYPNGRVDQDVKLDAEGRREGLTTSWHENGKLHQKVMFKADKPADGESVAYWDSGAVQAKVTYQNGALNGPYQEFYPNGQLKHSGPFVNGDKVGPVRDYFEDGALQHEATYLAEGVDGWSTRYYADGKVEEKQLYDHGTQRSYARWNEAGIQTVQWQWDQSHREQGEFKEWNEDGSLKSVKAYKDGKLLSECRDKSCG
ncbi:hypothetical protein LMG3431_03336 [Achromobacter pestifer]|uniref:Toxin-antitoxin system YwqK family antitoxin n=2 Tax=Achromobacter pestifer TaxID=1353889 RepID=A0A6S6Z8Q0_9BURK|nr:hypothetical protein LMG3431_03336 [Achromobacter pestifer]